ncbi:MAG: hypothetical protein WAL98_20130 [Desulfatiglandaceae bacterium]
MPQRHGEHRDIFFTLSLNMIALLSGEKTTWIPTYNRGAEKVKEKTIKAQTAGKIVEKLGDFFQETEPTHERIVVDIRRP